MEQNQITINEEKREQEARNYCEYTFKRFGIDADGQEAQLIRSAHIHGYNAGFEAARDEMQKMMYFPQEPESIPVPNSIDELEKEIEANYNPIDGLSFEDYRQIAKYFANWQRERIMQSALDGELVIGDEAQLCVPLLPRITRTMDNGDKVKVLIVKKR